LFNIINPLAITNPNNTNVISPDLGGTKRVRKYGELSGIDNISAGYKERDPRIDQDLFLLG